MDYKVKRSGSYEVELVIDFKSKDVEQAYQVAYQNARGRIKMDGFRKGKVPLEIVEKTLGDSVIEEVSNQLLRNALDEILDELEPQPINLPEFSVEKVDRKKGATIKGTYQAYPSFKLAKYKKLKITRDVPIVTDELIQKELLKKQKEHSTMHTRAEGEVVAPGDFIKASISIHKDSEQIFNNEQSNLELSDDVLLPGMNEQIVGLKVGESKEFDLSIPDDFNDENLAGATVQVAIEIKEISYAELPELNDDFAKDMGEFQSMDEYKKHLREQMIKEARNQLDDGLKHELLKQIAQASSIEIPPSMIEKESNYRLDRIAEQMGIKFPHNKAPSAAKSSRKRKKSNHNHSKSSLSLPEKIDFIISRVGMDKSKFEAELAQASRQSVGEQLVLREILEKEKIDVSDAEIISDTKEMYGSQIDDKFMETLLGNEDIKSNIRSQLLSKKTYNYIYSVADIKTGKEIPVDQIGTSNE